MDQRASKFAVVSAESDSTREQVTCPICGPNPTVFIGQSNNLPIVRCCGCDLVFVSEYVPLDSTLDFFRDKHMKDSDATRINYVNYRQKSLTREAARIRSLVPQGGRCLLGQKTTADQGIGTGASRASLSKGPGVLRSSSCRNTRLKNHVGVTA